MRIYDISRPLREGMAVYKNKDFKQFKRRIDSTYEKSHCNESSVVQWNLHAGTHVDAPLHMLDGGAPMAGMDLAACFGKALLVDCSDVEEIIGLERVRDLPLKKGDRVLFRTRNSSEEEYNPKFVYLSAEAAEHLAEVGVVLVGIDAMSVERDQPTHPAHDALLSRNIVILEDVRLAGIEPGEYELIALPISIPEAEAAPVRAILIER